VNRNDNFSRREVLGLSGAALAGLAGCKGDKSSGDSEKTNSPTQTDTRRPTASQTATQTATVTMRSTKSETPEDTSTATQSETPEDTPYQTPENPLDRGEETDLDVALSLQPQSEYRESQNTALMAVDADRLREASTDCAVDIQDGRLGLIQRTEIPYNSILAGSGDYERFGFVFDPEKYSRSEIRETLEKDAGLQKTGEFNEVVDILSGNNSLWDHFDESSPECFLGLYDFFLVYSDGNIADNPEPTVRDSLNGRLLDKSMIDEDGVLHNFWNDEDSFRQKNHPVAIHQGWPSSYVWAEPDHEADSVQNSEWLVDDRLLGPGTRDDKGLKENRPVTQTYDEDYEEATMWYPKFTKRVGIIEQNEVEKYDIIGDNLIYNMWQYVFSPG